MLRTCRKKDHEGTLVLPELLYKYLNLSRDTAPAPSWYPAPWQPASANTLTQEGRGVCASIFEHLERVRRVQKSESSLQVSNRQGCCPTCRQCQFRRLPCCRLECQAGLGQAQQPAELRTGSRESAGEASSSAAGPPADPTNAQELIATVSNCVVQTC